MTKCEKCNEPIWDDDNGKKTVCDKCLQAQKATELTDVLKQVLESNKKIQESIEERLAIKKIFEGVPADNLIKCCYMAWSSPCTFTNGLRLRFSVNGKEFDKDMELPTRVDIMVEKNKDEFLSKVFELIRNEVIKEIANNIAVDAARGTFTDLYR